MTVAQVITWFLIVAATYLVCVCYWLASAALFPRIVEGCRQRYGRSPLRITLTGLGVLVPLYAIGIFVVHRLPPVGPANALKMILMAPLLLAFLGSSGLALRVGEGLTDADAPRAWRSVLRGGLVLAPTFLVPFFGWFILLPWVLVSGVGAAVLTLASRPDA